MDAVLRHVTTTAKRVTVTSAAASATVKVEVPEKLRDVPRDILATVSMKKLVVQSEHLEVPTWAGLPQAKDAWLEQRKGSELLSPIRVGKLPFYVMGMSERVCDIPMAHPSLSRVHCALMHHKAGSLFILDMMSANGVAVNGCRIDPGKYTALKEGDVIRLGASTRTLTLHLSGAPERGARPEATPQTSQAPPVPAPAAPPAHGTVARKRERTPEVASGVAESAARAPPPPSEPVAQSAPRTPVAAPATAPVVPEAVVAVREPTPAPEPLTWHFYHILVKHKDVAQPVSKGVASRNQPVTRTLEDAQGIAAFLRQKFEGGKAASVAAFSDVVKEFSECATSKKGGDMGNVTQGKFLPVFEKVAFALGELEVSAPVVTALGVHLILRAPSD